MGYIGSPHGHGENWEIKPDNLDKNILNFLWPNKISNIIAKACFRKNAWERS
jgi:hypothetical protein